MLSVASILYHSLTHTVSDDLFEVLRLDLHLTEVGISTQSCHFVGHLDLITPYRVICTIRIVPVQDVLVNKKQFHKWQLYYTIFTLLDLIHRTLMEDLRE